MDRMLARFVDELLETAHVPATLDEAAQAEAWASGALAEWMDLGGGADELAPLIESSAPFAAALVRWLNGAPPPATGADWVADLGAQAPVEAWSLSSGPEAPEVAIIIEYEAPSSARHAVSVTIADGRSIDCSIGPSGLAEAAGEDDAGTMDVEQLPIADATNRVVDALTALIPEELSVNGRLNVPLVLHRFGIAPPEPALGAMPSARLIIPPRDPEDDAWAAGLVRSALRLHAEPVGAAWGPDTPADVLAAHQTFTASIEAGDADAHTAHDVAGIEPAADALAYLRTIGAYLRPANLSVHPVAVQEALLELEWADWLGSILGLARGDVGIDVDGARLVELINRCPEITTTIPRKDAARIGWTFEQTLYVWAATGVLDDTGALTSAGRWLLPRAALAAWEPQTDD